jgi:hypothetical protein
MGRLRRRFFLRAGPACISLALIAAVFSHLVVTAAATAARPASESEEMQFLRAASFGLGAHGRTAGMKLSELRVSTVDEHWAAARLILSNREGVVEGNGLAIFEHEPSRWSMRYYDFTHGGPCGNGAMVQMPAQVQLDLRLPSCPLGGARLGEIPAILDAGGAWATEPRSLTVEASSGPVTFAEIGAWQTWRVNRGATAHANATLLKSGTDKRVRVTLLRYRRCGRHVTFQTLEWGPVQGLGIGEHILRLSCPA